MDQRKWLIVGLGNPGKNYAKTRHNVGFMVADALAAKYEKSWDADGSASRRDENARVPEGSAPFEACTYTMAGQQVTVVKPLTYMNLSGVVVAKLAKKLGLLPGRCVVVSDEYNFPVGRVHLRKGGSDGGHNGLTSVIQELNSADFWRLRCGIGRDFGPGGLVDYVLGAFPDNDLPLLEIEITKAVQAIDLIVKHGAERAMQQINKVDPPPAADVT